MNVYEKNYKFYELTLEYEKRSAQMKSIHYFFFIQQLKIWSKSYSMRWERMGYYVQLAIYTMMTCILNRRTCTNKCTAKSQAVDHFHGLVRTSPCLSISNLMLIPNHTWHMTNSPPIRCRAINMVLITLYQHTAGA